MSSQETLTIQVEDGEGCGEEEGCRGPAGASPWYMIPRAALRRPQDRSPPDIDQSSTASSVTAAHVRHWLDSSPTHSNTSTQSGSSGSLLLTAANLAALRLEADGAAGGVVRGKEADAASLASSTHFTVVNYGRGKPATRSICAKHTVSVLVITTCSLFLIGLTAAVYYIDMRTKALRYS